MNALEPIFRSPLMETLGWTLFHSLWLGLVCYAVTFCALRIIPSKMSALRYAVSTVGLLSIFISSALAFISLSQTIAHVENNVNSVSGNLFILASYHPAEAAIAPGGALQTLSSALQQNMPLIVLAWAIGVLLFSLRIVGGYWYTGKIRSGATMLGYEWQDRIQHLAERLEILRPITLGESALIQAPVVMGYIKPMVLIPVGMMAGLSTDQIEAIFIHELIHIRRGDYLVNIIQTVLEAIFFFNPFVWALSAVMRREREHCCDDTVVQIHGNPLAYVRALATLEEVRLSRSGLALSLADDKKQLLKRIKRIMEKSVQQYSGRERYVPVILLLVGLICASWLTIQSERGKIKNDDQPNLFQEIKAAMDTSKKENSRRYYKRTHKSVDENGQPQYQIVEEYDSSDDGDESDVRISHIDIDIDPIEPIAPVPPVGAIDMDFDVPEAPDAPDMDFEIEVPEVPEIAEMPVIDFDFPFAFSMDTLGPHHWQSGHNWDEFGKAFEERFKEQFEDFYEQHQEDMEKILEEVQEKFHDREELGATKLEELRERQEDLARVQVESQQARMNSLTAVREAQVAQQAALAEVTSKMHAFNDEWVRNLEKQMHEMESVAAKELVKDGYLKEGEKINNIDISSDEGIKVNGKKIKASDEKKYRNLFDSANHVGRRE